MSYMSRLSFQRAITWSFLSREKNSNIGTVHSNTGIRTEKNSNTGPRMSPPADRPIWPYVG